MFRESLRGIAASEVSADSDLTLRSITSARLVDPAGSNIIKEADCRAGGRMGELSRAGEAVIDVIKTPPASRGLADRSHERSSSAHEQKNELSDHSIRSCDCVHRRPTFAPSSSPDVSFTRFSSHPSYPVHCVTFNGGFLYEIASIQWEKRYEPVSSKDMAKKLFSSTH